MSKSDQFLYEVNYFNHWRSLHEIWIMFEGIFLLVFMVRRDFTFISFSLKHDDCYLSFWSGYCIFVNFLNEKGKHLLWFSQLSILFASSTYSHSWKCVENTKFWVVSHSMWSWSQILLKLMNFFKHCNDVNMVQKVSSTTFLERRYIFLNQSWSQSF